MNAVLCRISVLFVSLVVIYFDQSIWVTVIITTNTTHILIYNRCRLFLLFRNSGIGVVSLASDVGGTCSQFVVQMTRVNAILQSVPLWAVCRSLQRFFVGFSLRPLGKGPLKY